MTKFMKELGYMKEKKVMVIWCDNQGAISLTNNHTQHVWTKHINVQHHFVWKWVENGKLTFEYCSTNRHGGGCAYQGITKKTT
jgi:hypothetical protein